LRSTFANFIHQMDASIAGDVVRTCIGFEMPIYTVHDNLISKTQHSERLPFIYTKAFIRMMDPLYIINRLLYLNLIGYSKDHKTIMNRKEDVELFYDSEIELSIKRTKQGVHLRSDEPLAREMLAEIFKSLEPQSLPNAKRNTWNKHCTELLNAYDAFVDEIHLPPHKAYDVIVKKLVKHKHLDEDSLTDYDKKYLLFNELLKESLYDEEIYALHPEDHQVTRIEREEGRRKERGNSNR